MNKGETLDNIVKDITRDETNGLLPFEFQKKISAKYNLPLWEVEQYALLADIVPKRYARNRKSIDAVDQLKLLSSRVAITGCGGLGGHVATMLARIGIGEMLLIDPDIFDETNLNRQSFATIDTLGEYKVSVLERELTDINPALRVYPHISRLDPKNDFDIIAGADVVIDALDDPAIKLSLASECVDRSIPFVHGAIAGMSGQVSVNTTLEHLYHDDSRGVEEKMGNLSFSAALVASLQVSETVKLLLGIGDTLDGKILITDLLYDDFTQLPA